MACLLLAAASSAFAQRISVGIKAGVPLTGLLRTNSVRAVYDGISDTNEALYHRSGSGYRAPAWIRRRIWRDVQALRSAVHCRHHDRLSTSDDETGYPIQQTAGISAVGHSWEFPVAVQYRFFKSAIRPYVEGGVSLNRLSNVYSFQNVSIHFRQLPFTFAPLRGSFTRVGPLFGMGVDVKLHRIHVTPGLRYTHYNKLSALTACISGPGCPSNKAVDFLVGFTF